MLTLKCFYGYPDLLLWNMFVWSVFSFLKSLPNCLLALLFWEICCGCWWLGGRTFLSLLPNPKVDCHVWEAACHGVCWSLLSFLWHAVLPGLTTPWCMWTARCTGSLLCSLVSSPSSLLVQAVRPKVRPFGDPGLRKRFTVSNQSQGNQLPGCSGLTETLRKRMRGEQKSFSISLLRFFS